jgi:hypothetical protein
MRPINRKRRALKAGNDPSIVAYSGALPTEFFTL